jgi:hypothetical protein
MYASCGGHQKYSVYFFLLNLVYGFRWESLILPSETTLNTKRLVLNTNLNIVSKLYHRHCIFYEIQGSLKNAFVEVYIMY